MSRPDWYLWVTGSPTTYVLSTAECDLYSFGDQFTQLSVNITLEVHCPPYDAQAEAPRDVEREYGDFT
jgi:hypothetical protein